MAARGEHNIGQLCRKEFRDKAYLVGFGTHGGTVAAASEWGGPMEVKTVRPALPNSYEQLRHATGLPRFMLGLRSRGDLCGPTGLGKPRLERAIGVIYRPETEFASHYFQANLPQQFDEYVWFDETHAVTPLETAEIKGPPDTLSVRAVKQEPRPGANRPVMSQFVVRFMKGILGENGQEAEICQSSMEIDASNKIDVCDVGINDDPQ